MNQQNSQELMKCIVRAADDRLGQDILALDVQNLTPLADYFVLVTAKNDRQLQAIVESIEEAMEGAGYIIKSKEGQAGTRWYLLDCTDVVVHVFTKDEREHYHLEKLWSDAPIVNLEGILSDEA